MRQRRYEALACLRRDAVFVNANSKDVHPHEWMTQNTAKWDEFLDWKFSARIGKDELLKCTRNLLYCLSYLQVRHCMIEY